MEIELARARLDVMKLDSQLMEAIQQKIQLSQQLEQWQVWKETIHVFNSLICEKYSKFFLK